MKKTTSVQKASEKRQKARLSQRKQPSPKVKTNSAAKQSLSFVSDVFQVIVPANKIPESVQKSGQNCQIDLTLNDDSQRVKSKSLINISSVKKKLFKSQLKQGQTFTNSIIRFQKRLRQNWFKNPAMEFLQFFEIAKRQFMLVDPINRQFVNLNKRWCINYFKGLNGKRHIPDAHILSQDLMEEEDKYEVAESIEDEVYEPKTVLVQKNVGNSSELWRKHTLKLLYQKHPGQKEKEMEEAKDGSDLYVINESMKKTLENRSEEIFRLQRQAQRIKNFIEPSKVVFNLKAAKVQTFSELYDLSQRLNPSVVTSNKREQPKQISGVSLHVQKSAEKIVEEGEVKEQQ